MTIFEALSPAERARQLANPEGAIGLALAEWLNDTNRQATTELIRLLAVEAGHRVLEIGFGNGRAVPIVMAQAADVHYAGVDISPTMVAEARDFNAALVQAGRAGFDLASSHAMPFDTGSFDRVFAIGVVHFWAEPLASLAEVRRVLRPGGLMLMGCLAPEGAPDFAQVEYGFHLRAAPEWDDLCRSSGFADVDVRLLEISQSVPGGSPIRRSSIRLQARA
ncbi:class I SAM-dependent methyltransferase [Bradyrhizobium sp.]|uniref:class I SAM-dependent methyltransferase n=1 Tax=Bradyrhizobium sp. TaxID=376 RepID=UPI0039E2B130